MQFRRPFLALTFFTLIFSAFPIVHAQSVTAIECGAIVEAETTSNETLHDYRLMISAGTVLNLSIEPIGSTFNVAAFLYDSGGSEFAAVNSVAAGGKEEFSDLIVSSSNPTLRILGTDPNWAQTYSINTRNPTHFGAYLILFGCTLRDGTVIEPGDPMSDASSTGVSPVTTKPSVPPFSGVGFPGLDPVDFAGVLNLPLIAATPMTGVVTPAGGEILGFQFDANAGDVMVLDFSKLSGNLNLGLVVLSANNEVVFQASLVTSESLSTRLTLPSAGQYTIGVFRIDLLPPAAPEATAFQITGTLNP